MAGSLAQLAPAQASPAESTSAQASSTQASSAQASSAEASSAQPRVSSARAAAAPQATVPPDCSAPAGTPGSASNVRAPHSPQLLQALASPHAATAATAATAAHAAAAGTAATGPAAAPPGAVRGVDVAAFQHPVTTQFPQGAPIGWAQVARSGIQFAAIKATEGNYYVNPFYAADRAGARAARLAVIAYAFANPKPKCGTAAGQAQYLVSHARAAGPVPPLVLDIEYNPYQGGECYGRTAAAMVTWIRQFEAKVKALTKHLPIIYTTQDWWARCTGGSSALAAGPVWAAAYSAATGPPVPAGWSDWALWQYTSSGTVPGIVANRTDLDALNLLSPGGQSVPARQPVSVAASQVSAGPDPGLTYRSAGLPPGLTLGSRGLVSGSPAASVAGQQETITAAWGAVLGSVKITWTVTGPVTAAAPPGRTTAAGSPVDFAVPAATVPSGQNVVFTASGLPAGTAISASGQVTGWPLGRGSHRVVLHAADAAGDAGLASFTWKITAAPGGGPAGEVQSGARGECLTDPGGATAGGTPVRTAACGRAAGQAWTVAADGTLRTSGRCLAAGAPPARRAVLAACSAAAAGQRWFAGPGGGLVSAAHGGCLTGPRAGAGALRVAHCASGPGQAWTRPAGPVSSQIPGFCLTDVHGSAAAHAGVVIGACSGGPAQAFAVLPGGTVRIRGRCLEVNHTVSSRKFPVDLAACTGVAAERWTVTAVPGAPAGAGSWLRNRATGQCLTNPAELGDKFVAAPAAVTGACSAAVPGAAWQLR
ncbi:MAG TPA: GH25 family lysozyme [Streptosporangiaceae bacterium]